jgi:uncharacterized protein
VQPAGGGKLLSFGGTPVAPGEMAEIRLKVSESYFAEPVAIPLTVVRGSPGPVLYLTASVHGDELNGVGVIHELLDGLPLEGLKGTLIAVPIVNVPGFLAQDRRLPDRRDLNRSFPGSPRGSLAARLADTLFREVVRKSDFGIDLHTAGGERTNYPQVRADLSDPRVAELAHAFGCPVVVDGKGPERSLRRTAVEAGVPTLVYEAGSALRFERPVIEIGAAGIRNVLHYLGMLPGQAVTPPLRAVIRRSGWVRARAGGILDLRIELGQPVRRNQLLWVNSDPFGRGRTQLKAPHGGLVLGLTQLPLVHPGDAVCHLARLDSREMEAWTAYWERGGGRIRP